MSADTFIQRLERRAQTIDSLLCVGLDPHPELLPDNTAAAARDYCKHLIDRTASYAAAFKPNSAFFEAFGGDGAEALRSVIEYVPDGVPVILDAKRGDIASTAQAYARAAFETLGASAITVNPYMGYDAVYPFLTDPGKGAFVLCKTSNPGADVFQNLMIQDKPLYEVVALQAAQWNEGGNVGLVVGAADIPALARLRSLVPALWFLLPGIGAQGGDLRAALDAGLRADTLGVLVTVSRSLARASDPGFEASRLRDQINELRFTMSSRPRPPVDEPLEQLALALAQAGCVQVGDFTLKSGEQSPIYLDLRRLSSSPAALRVVSAALVEILRALQFDHLAPIPYAGLPLGTAAALALNASMIYPRREVKDYGTRASVEGVFESGDTAVVVDDLATKGDAKLEAIEVLRAAGLQIRDVVVLIDRQQGAAETLTQAGCRLHAVTTLSELLPLWERQGIMTEYQRRVIEDYLRTA
jgi:uridine monophosphate synthetase